MNPTVPNQGGQMAPPAMPSPGSSFHPTTAQDAPQATAFQTGQALHYQPPQQAPLAAAPPENQGIHYHAPLAPTAAPAPAPGAQQAAAAPKTNPNSTQNMLQLAEVRDGIVIMNDGSFRSVVMVKSINFDLMSPQEQEAVEYSYQGFLNSLYFPIQIFIRSQKVDLQPNIGKLAKIRNEHDNMLLAVLMDDYINYIDQLSQQTNIMDKRFYIVIPFFPTTDVQKALTQSKNFLDGLKGLLATKEQHVTINEADLEKAK